MAENTIIRRTFTWSEWIAKAETQGSFKGSHGDDGWAGGSRSDALRMAKTDGYQAAMPEAELLATGMTETVSAHVMAETFQAAYDVQGAEVDLGRYLEGVPECMIESQPMKIARAGRAVRIVVPFSFSAGVREDIVRRRGAAVIALIYVLQQLQHPLEVWGGMAITGFGNDSKRLNYLVEIQRADEPVDIGRIMYALAHPTMLRRLGFAVEDHEAEDIRQTFHIGHGYGMPSPNVPSDLPDQAGTTIILPMLGMGERWTPEESVEWIEAQLRLIFGSTE